MTNVFSSSNKFDLIFKLYFFNYFFNLQKSRGISHSDRIRVISSKLLPIYAVGSLNNSKNNNQKPFRLAANPVSYVSLVQLLCLTFFVKPWWIVAKLANFLGLKKLQVLPFHHILFLLFRYSNVPIVKELKLSANGR